MRFRSWEATLELRPGQRLTITQKHTTKAHPELWHADGRPFYYLDVEVAVPGCSDAYDGAYCQTYQCKNVQGGGRVITMSIDWMGSIYEWHTRQSETRDRQK